MIDTVGNTSSAALNIDFLNNVPKVFEDEIGGEDFADYFRFELAENSAVSLLLTGLSKNANLFLRNADDSRELARSANAGSVAERIDLNLRADVYYLYVGGGETGTPYKLTASAIALGPVPIDLAGENIDNAKDLGVLSANAVLANDFIGNFNGISQDFADYYQFTIAENSTVSLKLNGLSQNASLALYNSDDSRLIEQSNNSGNIDELIGRNLKAGRYYLRINSSQGTTYQLEASAVSLGAFPPDGAGDSFDQAGDIGILSDEGVTLSDYVGDFNGLAQDFSDYYRFELTENSAASFKLSGLSQNASLLLYNSDGSRAITQSNNTGTIDELIDRNLKAGIYYLAINSSQGTTYQLEASATSLGAFPIDNAGDDYDRARDLGTLTSEGVTLSDFVGDFNGLAQDFSDYYRFELAENSTINLKLSGLSENAQLYLQNSTGQAIESSTNVGTADELIDRNLKAGIYYLYVNSSQGTSYQLEAAATSLGAFPADAAGDVPDKARNLGVLGSESLTISDFVGDFNGLDQDFSDYYRFELAENSSVNFKLSGLSGNAQLYLQTSDNRGIESSTNVDNADELISRNLRAGTYYVYVSSSQGTAYELEASAVSLGAFPVDEAGDNIDTAKDLGPLGTQAVSASDFVGDFNGISQDFSDYYRFEVSESSTVSLTLSGLSDRASLFVFNNDASQTVASASNNNSSDNKIVTEDLRAGVYYAYVSGGGSSTPYQLRASAIPTVITDPGFLANATDLGILGGSTITANDSLDSSNFSDYYKFKVSGNSTIDLTLSGLSSNADISLYSADGSRELARSSNANSSNESIIRNLRAGTYYVGVNNVSGGTTAYRLDAIATALGPVPADLAGNNIDQARSLGDLNAGSANINEFIGGFNDLSYDFTDTYQFNISENSAISLKLSGLSDDASLSLYGSDGSREIISSRNEGNANEIIARNLKADTYYIYVNAGSSVTGTTYQLEAIATSLGPIPADLADENLNKARDLGIVGTDAVIANDFIGNFNDLSYDYSDYYKLTIAENSTLSLMLSGLSDDASLSLYNSGGSRELARSTNAGNANEVITQNLKADTYYVFVSSGSSVTGTTYQLETSAVSLGAIPIDAAGDSLDKAKDLGTLGAEVTAVSEFIGNFNNLSYDYTDTYKFAVAENSTINLKLSGLSDDASLTLVNSDGSRNLASSSNAGNADELISLNLKADTYYIYVNGGNSTTGTTYQLEASAISLGAIPIDLAGDNFDKARDLGTIGTETTAISDFVGNFNNLSYDSTDIYRFTLADNSTINLKLSGLSDDAFLSVYNSDGSRVLASSNNAGNADELVSLNLRADTYYVYVEGGYTTGTAYQLEASAISLGPVPVDMAGENVDKARDLGVLNSTQISLSDFVGDFAGLSQDYTDYYKFKLAENSEVSLGLSGLSSNSGLVLYNSDLSRVIDSSNNQDNNAENITRNLRAGTYYFTVENYSAQGTDYQIKASATSFGVYEDKAGDTLETARDLGVLSKSRSFEDFIGNYFGLVQDSADIYKFELKETSTLNLALNRLNTGARVSLQLLDAQGGAIASSNSNTLNTALVAGTYYFQVTSNSSEGTTYSLTATGAPILDLAGNSVGAARDIGNLNGSRAFTDYIGDLDRDDFYRFDLAARSSVNLSTSPATLGRPVNVRLLDSKGNSVESSNGSINRDLDAGAYYAQVTGGDTYYDVAFSAVPEAAGPFQISAITPIEGSNSGQTTITVKGSQFTSAAQVSIIDASGTEFIADKVSVRTESSLSATFNLVGVATGAYDIKVVDTAGTATAEDLFSVTTGTPGDLDVFISAPSALRPWSTGEVVVTYRNSGDSDITAPLLTLKAEGANFEEDGEYGDGTIQFLAINREGDAGVLPPGATGTFTAKFRPQPGITNIDFVVNSLATGETVDWNAIEDSSRPENIPVETWDVIFKNFTDEVGELAGQYEKVLAENASRLSELGEYTGDVSKLLSFELQQGNSQAIFERFTEGSFGRGWNNPWDVTASANGDSDVVIRNGGSLRFFERQTDGSYRGGEGDTATLTQQGNSYQLREEDGTVIAFLENGKLDSIVDSNGNEVVAGYTGSNLTTLTYSNGDLVSFAYNAAGKVREVTDPFGQKTTYTYDAANERLLSVTDENGTVSYTYETSGAKANAIKSITFPDGTQTLYEYDDQGRVTQESRNDGAEVVSYAYDSAGKVTVTDAAGNTAQLFQNTGGQVSRTVDALGRTTAFRYDDTGNLTRITAPNDSISTFNYDSRGNLISSTDPLGQQVSFTYDSEFNQIQTVRDQRGNSIGYSYDDAGNLDGIVYADGSGETYQYNGKGEVTVSINRRGEAINYSYDSRGLLTQKVFADGTEATFEYDTRGNLTKAVDADSSVTYAYDSANRLTKVTYGTGRFLQFAYDAGGRRSQMVDQDGFTTNYLYDNVGRLQQLTDKDNANVITYSYDNIGQLTREDNGNGTYTTYNYDTAGQLLSIVNYQPDGDINSRYDYTYDELGQRTSMTTLEGTTSYGYDATGQLTSVSLPNGREIFYEYDGAGNRISVTDDGVTTSYSTNNLNQYNTVGSATYTYDADGNLISKVDGSDTWTYSYDIENRLIGVTTPEGTWAYEYDALGNRIASVEGGDRTEYLIDPSGLGNIVEEFDGSDAFRYTHGLDLVGRFDSANFGSYYDSDAIGSVVGISGDSGIYENFYSYLPFGESVTESETFSNPFQFTGTLGVTEEVNGLNFMRARFYSSDDGRFIKPDPIGISGGTNLYAYVSNNPVVLADPSGLCFNFSGEVELGGTLAFTPFGVGTFGSGGVAVGVNTLGQFYVKQRVSGGGALGLGGYAGASLSLGGGASLGRLKKGNNTSISGRAEANGAWGWGGGASAELDPQGSVSGSKLGANYGYGAMVGLGGSLSNTYALNDPWWGCDEPGSDDSGTPTSDKGGDNIGDESEGSSSGDEKASGDSDVVTSFDPNDILGPSGSGPLNYITPTQTLPYTIRFENQASATAPAVFVTITQTLDPDLDLSTFELGSFGFGDLYIEVPEGFQTYSTRLDLRETLGDFVDFNATLNPDTGEVIWTLTTIDPATGNIPDDVDAGFLPPNNDDHDGEGFVTYRVNAKPGLPTGTRLDAEASIVFDTNEAIETPAIFNTLDVGLPTSQVTALPATVSPTFEVSWSGTDDGSGIASYDIFVSENGSDYTLWQDDITETSATYQGQANLTYRFYSVAKDNVGYAERAPNVADAITTPVNATDRNIVSTVFDVVNDHVLNGEANITFTLANQGTTATGEFTVDIIHSDDDIIGNGDDIIVDTITIDGLDGGAQLTQNISVQLSKSLLNSRAELDDGSGQVNGYVSTSYDYLGIVINDGSQPEDAVTAPQSKGITKDDITYFPWDIDGNRTVTPTDAIFVINRLGQATSEANRLADLDGNGLITPTDAIATINRLGYSINSSVFEDAIA